MYLECVCSLWVCVYVNVRAEHVCFVCASTLSVCAYEARVYLCLRTLCVRMRVLVFCAGMSAENNFVIDIRTIC